MLALVRRNMRHGSEHVRTVCSRAFNAVSVIDATLASFMVHIKVLEIVVEVDGTSAEISAEEGCMRCEHSCHIDVALAAKRYGETCLPLMEMGNDSCMCLAGDVL